MRLASKKIFTTMVFAVLFFSGCIPGNISQISKSPSLTPQGVLDKIVAQQNREGTIKALAKISISSSEGDYSRKVALLLRMPSFLRIETIPFFGPADFLLSVNRESLKVFFPAEGEFYVGSPTQENLFLFFKIFLPPSDVIPLLSGVLPYINNELISGHIEGDLYALDLRAGKKRRLLWVNPADDTLHRIKALENDEICWSAAFKDHLLVNGISYPRSIRIEIKSPEKITIEIKYSELAVADEENPAIFDLPTPYGVRQIPIH